ncbi:hypothetical protein DL93DRAFT_482779 [Clavulina sp. PMI_390]|nr:hypothetical protein DL93DRAFT_482779 [Clavulina sp. PMI_390]
MGRWDFLPFVRYKKSSKRRSLHPDTSRDANTQQADPLDKQHAASVATNGNNPTPRLVSSFLKLPEDVLIEILCHSLTPRDIIAVSHTCRILRLCASSLIVWECAWGRDDSLPALNPPNIIPIHATSVYSEEDGTELTLEQPLPSLTFGPPSLQQLGFSLPPPHKALDPLWGTWSQGWNRHQKIYWSMMRVRHQLAHSEPVVAPVHRLLHQHPIMDFIDMRLTPNGEVLVTYLAHEVRLMHLEMGKMLVLPIRIETSFNGPYSVPVVCGIFTHKGKDGVLFAAPFSQKNQVNVFFQPFDSFRDNESLARQECPPAFTNVDLPVEWTVSHLSLVGQFLIVGDIIEGASWWTYRVANLTTRHPRR